MFNTGDEVQIIAPGRFQGKRGTIIETGIKDFDIQEGEAVVLSMVRYNVYHDKKRNGFTGLFKDSELYKLEGETTMSNEIKKPAVYNNETTIGAIGYARILKQCPYWYKVLPIASFKYDESRNEEAVEVIVRTFSTHNELSVGTVQCTAWFYGKEFEIVNS